MTPESQIAEGQLERDRFFRLALQFEGGLIFVAVAAGWIVGHPPLAYFAYDARGTMWGVAGTLPMLGLLAVTNYVPAGPFRRLRRFLDAQVLPIFAGWSVWGLATVSLLAGVGEEMLFRGVIQTALGDWINPAAGLAIGAVVFGLLHAMTPAYAVVATLTGAYLGWLYLWSGNLLAPMIAHGLYDFVALVFLLKQKRAGERGT